ncbi:MAG: hypothetical protein C4306_04435, partial [Thermoleophilia bacterium]
MAQPLPTLALGLPALATLDFGSGRWFPFLVLVLFGIAAQTLVEQADRERAHRVAVVVVLAAGALLLPPEQVALAAFFLYLPRWLKMLEGPWQAHARELFTDLGGGMAAWGAAALADRLAASLVGPKLALALAGLGACLALAGAGRLPAFLLKLARAGRDGKGVGHLSRRSPALGPETELALSALGVALAAMWLLDPWLLPFAAAPFLLVQHSFRIPLLEYQARLDPKTGLFNAAYFDVALERELAAARAFGRPLAVMVADLDLLREINAAHGHLGGDAVIRGVAAILKENLRPEDVPARFGGEEMAVILPGVDASGALQVAERVRRAVASTTFFSEAGGEPIRASLSIGVASFSEHGTTATELVHRADLAVYRAKLQGRNRVVVASLDPLARPLQRVFSPSAAARAESQGGNGSASSKPDPCRSRPSFFLASLALLPASALAGSLSLALTSGAPSLDGALSGLALALAVAGALVALRPRADVARS